MRKHLVFVVLALALTACGHKAQQAVEPPAFAGDTAFQYVAWQVRMGARVPGSDAHAKCSINLFRLLDRYGASPEMQMGTKTNYAGEEQQIYNIIGHFGPMDAKNRILLCAHYDCRPWSDMEDAFENKYLPVPGANDGASGVGVLLEVARQLGLQDSLAPAVDIVFFDCEDMGTPEFYTGVEREHTWCLGSQLWAERAIKTGWNKMFQYGILLDMVGAPNAVFAKEYYSRQNAGSYVEKVWRHARDLGHSDLFVQQETYPVMDDHYYVGLAGVPCLDIIHYDISGDTGFPFWWHTQQDNMRNISRETLQAVGEVVMATIME